MHEPVYPVEDWSWRWLDPPERDLPNRVDLVRSGAAAIALAFSGSGVGVKPGRDKRKVDLFHFITEGRTRGNPRYSACGDIVGAVLCFLGCRSESIVNRDDDNLDDRRDIVSHEPDLSEWDVRGVKAWKLGWNLALLRQGAIDVGAWNRAKHGLCPLKGDYFLVDYGTGLDHVGVVASDPVKQADGSFLFKTVEGGQVDSLGQCVETYTTTLYRAPSGLMMMKREGKSPRVLDGWASVTDIPLAVPSLLPRGAEDLGIEVE